MKECKCKDWKDNAGILTSAVTHYYIRYKRELKKSFNYCPYCGIKLKVAKSCTEEKNGK